MTSGFEKWKEDAEDDKRGEEKEGTYPKPVCLLTPAKTTEIARASKA